MIGPSAWGVSGYSAALPLYLSPGRWQSYCGIDRQIGLPPCLANNIRDSRPPFPQQRWGSTSCEVLCLLGQQPLTAFVFGCSGNAMRTSLAG